MIACKYNIMRSIVVAKLFSLYAFCVFPEAAAREAQMR